MTDPTPAPALETPAPVRPPPTHIVEVQLVGGDTLLGVARTERYFYADEVYAEAAYRQIGGALQGLANRDNDVPSLLEVDDLYGRGSFITKDLRSVRLVASADLDDWGIAQQAKLAGAKQRAQVRAYDEAGADDPEFAEVGVEERA